jgi:hypothetical protein
MSAAFAVMVFLFLTGVVALFGGAAAIAAYSLAQLGHLLVNLGQFGGSVFLGALGGAAMAGSARHVGWKSASLAGGSWYQDHLAPEVL